MNHHPKKHTIEQIISWNIYERNNLLLFDFYKHFWFLESWTNSVHNGLSLQATIKTPQNIHYRYVNWYKLWKTNWHHIEINTFYTNNIKCTLNWRKQNHISHFYHNYVELWINSSMTNCLKINICIGVLGYVILMIQNDKCVFIYQQYVLFCITNTGKKTSIC